MAAAPALTPAAIVAAIDDFAKSPQRGLAAFQRLRPAAQHSSRDTLARKGGQRGGWHAGRADKESADALVTRFWVAAVYHGLHAHCQQSVEDFVGDEFRVPAAAAPGSLLAPRIREVARITEAWGADFWAVLHRQGISLQRDPSKSLVEQLAVAAGCYTDVRAFAAAFTPFYSTHRTRGRRATVDVVTAANVREFLRSSGDAFLTGLTELTEEPRQPRTQLLPPTTPLTSLLKRPRAQPGKETDGLEDATSEVQPRKVASMPSVAELRSPLTAGEQNRHSMARTPEPPRSIRLPEIGMQPSDEDGEEQTDEEELEGRVIPLPSPPPLQPRADSQELTVTGSGDMGIHGNVAEEEDNESQTASSIHKRTVDMAHNVGEKKRVLQRTRVFTKDSQKREAAAERVFHASVEDLYKTLFPNASHPPSVSTLKAKVAELEAKIQQKKENIAAIASIRSDEDSDSSLSDEASVFANAIHREVNRLNRTLIRAIELRDALQKVIDTIIVEEAEQAEMNA